jgi:hypothetical protein
MNTKILFIDILLSVLLANVQGQNLLKDGNFESSVPDGSCPLSGTWGKSWYPEEAGAVTTFTAAKNGRCGLWIYTSTGSSFCRPYQEFQCTPLAGYKAEAYLRCPNDEPWTKGTVAFVSISFINKAGNVLSTSNSDLLRTVNTAWQLYSVSLIAPQGALKVRFSINLESNMGQSILNADNCSLAVY